MKYPKGEGGEHPAIIKYREIIEKLTLKHAPEEPEPTPEKKPEKQEETNQGYTRGPSIIRLISAVIGAVLGSYVLTETTSTMIGLMNEPSITYVNTSGFYEPATRVLGIAPLFPFITVIFMIGEMIFANLKDYEEPTEEYTKEIIKATKEQDRENLRIEPKEHIPRVNIKRQNNKYRKHRKHVTR